MAMTLQHLALNVLTAGLAHYGECHFDACAAERRTEGYAADKTTERHQRRNGSSGKAQCKGC